MPLDAGPPFPNASSAPAPSLTRRFVALGAIVLCLTAFVMADLDRRSSEADISRWAEASNASLTIAIANAVWPRYAAYLEHAQGRTSEALRADPESRRLLDEIKSFVAGLDVLKVKLYDLQGTTVFSSDPGQIGADYSGNPRFLQAALGGFASELERRETFGAFTGKLTDRWVLSSYVPVRPGDGTRIMGVAEIYRDVTAQRADARQSRYVRTAIIGGALVVVFGVLVLIVWKSDRRLAEQHRRELALAASAAEANARSEAKTRFLANMGHELRTPLNAIIGFSDFIATGAFGPVSPARYADYANDINGSGLRLLRVINDILDIVNCESDRLELRYARKPVDRLVADALQQVTDEARESGVQLVNEVGADTTELHCDPARLQQSLGNLLSNAVRFTRPGGTVRVTATRAGDGSLTLAVIDDGIGIAATDLPRIMEPFQQVDSGLARKYDGAGLGIPLARAIARLHGGDIVYESEVGRGTAARLILPADRVIAAEPLRKSA